MSGVDDFKNDPILTAKVQFLEWILGDHTVIQVDDKVHLIANTIFHGINQYVGNLTHFERVHTPVWYPGSVRPYVFSHEGSVYLFYEQYSLLSLYKASTIQVVRALDSDLSKWSKPATNLKPE